MSEKLSDIEAIENKYGLMLFRMGLTHLIEVGTRHLDDERVDECIKQIEAESEKGNDGKSIPVMTPEFKCGVVRCAAELAKFSVWTLIAYIKKYIAVNIADDVQEEFK